MVAGMIVIYLLAMNVFGFCQMGMDKRRAVRHEYRISERALFLGSILGGSLGSWLGMYVFRHKTRRQHFVLGMPLIFLVHVGIILLCLLI